MEILKKYIVEHVDDNKKILERLLDELLAKDTVEGLGCDNMTSILIRFKWNRLALILEGWMGRVGKGSFKFCKGLNCDFYFFRL